MALPEINSQLASVLLGDSPPKTGNLPDQTTPFLGREMELEEISRLLRDPSCRLLTLVGPGGVGKTRLGLQVAANCADVFPDGVYFMSLASVQSSEYLVSALASVLDISFFGEGDIKKQIVNYLYEKEILLVMDNFEHLLNEADWLSNLLGEAEKLKLLVTSRESLGLKKEKKYEIHGMDIPEREEDLENYGSVQLFLQEARRVKPGFKLEDDQKIALVQLCKFLEGLPLGLELAAAWVSSLSLEEILQQVTKNMDFLESTHGHLSERHRSLRAVFEHSWNSLGPNQKAILRKLTIFQGGISEEAASAVTEAPPTSLYLLADKSFLRRSVPGRFEMHMILKQFADEKLTEAETDREEARKRHCVFFAQFVKEWASLLSGPRQKEALEEVGREIGNIRLAWTQALEQAMTRELEMFLEGLYFYYDFRGLNEEGEKIFGLAAQFLGPRAVQALGREQHALMALYGEALARQGIFHYRLGNYEKATDLLRKSLSILRQNGTAQQLAFTINHLCFVLSRVSADFEEAKKLLEESLRICRHGGDKSGTALSLKNQGFINWRVGNYTDARAQWKESLEISKALGEPNAIAGILTETAQLAFDESHYEEARDLNLRSLEIYRQIGHRNGEAWAEGKVGNVNWALGEFGEAVRFYTESLGNFKKMGDQEGMAWALNSLGHALRATGDYSRAHECYRSGLSIYQKASHRWGIAWSLANIGVMESLLGHPDDAERRLNEANVIFKEIGNPWGTAFSLDGLGMAAFHKKQWDKAKAFYQESFNIFHQTGNQREMAVALHHLGELYLILKDIPKSRETLLSALRTAMEISAFPVVLRIFADLCLLRFEAGQKEESLTCAYFILHHHAVEHETRQKVERFVALLKPHFSTEKGVEAEKRAQTLDWKRVVESLLTA
ncbi:MAG TPA: tetratricopeptide repeat protein [bacterium]